MKTKTIVTTFILSSLLAATAPAATTSFDIQSGSNTQSGFTAVTAFPTSDGMVTITVDNNPTNYRDRAGNAVTKLDGHPDTAILRDLAFWNSSSNVSNPVYVATFTFSGLQADTEYSGLAWVWDNEQGNNGKSFNLTTAGGSGGGTTSITNTQNTLAFAQTGPFELVNFTSTETGTATIAMHSVAGGVSFVNGFQLTAIPEPSTALLGGLGLLALLRRRR